jgi:hypothetical protein
MSTISNSEALQLRTIYEQFESWRNGRTSYRTNEVPEHLRSFGNKERGALELYDFVHNPPKRYFAYYKDNAVLGDNVITFMGDKLGTIVSVSAPWQSNLGDKRRMVTVQAINGLTYRGIAQLSAGNYVRLHAIDKSNA